MRFLFWNTNKKNNDRYISQLIVDNKIDLFCAAEYNGNIDKLCDSIINERKYHVLIAPGCERITLLSNQDGFSAGFQNTYCSMQIMNSNFIICFIHLPSKLHNDPTRRVLIINEIIEQINKYEKMKSINNTIVVGDFNINPYEDSCLRVDQFHSIPFENEAKRLSRTFQGKEYKMFYNPMWGLLGDWNTPYGTYFLPSGDSICPYWNIYDQVIIRPSLIGKFKKNKLEILTSCGDESLLDENSRPRKDISDHLPIVFEIEV